MSSLSVRTRFEVFKRDRFTCSYCGKTPPDVLLEVDHIIPRAAGGTDDITNLTTACWDCNSGKSDRLLEEGSAPTVQRAVVDNLRERLEQAAAYTELVGQQANLMEKQVWLVNEVWAKAFGAVLTETDEGTRWSFDGYGRFPEDRSLRMFVRRIPVHELLAAIDITGSRFSSASGGACKFFYKICWNRLKGGGPIDGPAPAQREPEPLADEPPWKDWYNTTRAQLEEVIEERDDALIAADAAKGRIEDLEDEVRDLRKIIETYQEERSGRLTRLGE